MNEEVLEAIAALEAAEEALRYAHLRFWHLTDDMDRQYRPPVSDRLQMGRAIDDFRNARIRSTVHTKVEIQRRTQFEHFKPEAQAAIRAVGKATFFDGEGTRLETYNVIYARSAP